jgi:phosphatidylglycerol---prolipoprotein diacylglyceryl transferase
MHPILFEWGSIRIGSYGLMLTLAFLAAIVVTNREFRRRAVDVNLAWDIYLLAIIGGLVGSRLLYILETPGEFAARPWAVLVSSTGFSVIGGYLLAFALCFWHVRRQGQRFLLLADLTAPGLAIGYAVGRLGCILAGDGCYGLPTKAWCGMTFPHGIVPTLSAQNPGLAHFHRLRFPGEPVPPNIAVHPTPLYESLSHFLLLVILLSPRWTTRPVGHRLAFFLGWFGLSRFLVEFIRLNPQSWLGLTSDQWLALGLAATAIALRLFAPTATPTDTGETDDAKHAPPCVS